jgi:HK97 family phage major capsid protein
MDMNDISKALGGIESKLAAYAEKAEHEIKAAGSQSVETKNAIEKLGEQQREFAERLLVIEQKGPSLTDGEGRKVDDWGQQFVKSERYKAFQTGATNKVRLEVKNTLTGDDTNVAPDRKPGVVPGAFTPLLIESLYPSLPTSSNAIEFTKEASFTNSAAEAAEGVAKAESALTWSLVNMPVSTVAHWIKISRQLAADNAALAAYVNTRMRYGVNKRVDTQLVAGNGTAPNISGFLDSGNFTAHGIADASLGSVLKKLVLIRKIIGDLQAAGYAPDAIVLNPADWATIDTDLLTSTSNAVRVNYNAAGEPMLWGVRVVASVGMTADSVAVGAFAQHGTIYNREGVVVDMSESDSDNFTKNLITIRAERRLALATEVPAALRAGDLTPA